ncbi:MAG: UDP-N-acetylmuramoyl-L-alanine--D-glutamate ligase [Acidobacteria bacterium]|nr:MAG: UDP-N-acetylmuramoyl-L-alanine--D-glutamate ligase [Acidobacteriota bacterium]
MEATGFTVRGRRIVVVGAARSGIAAAELAARKGARVLLTETRDTFDAADRLRTQGIELELGGHTAETLATADLIVTSPGVPTEQPVFDAARGKGVETIGELEFASRWITGRVIAITGTKGKSTTTTLIGRMLDAAGQKVLVGGNIGTPLSAQVEHSTADTIHVVETSSFQLETTTTFHPWIAVWLNFADDHLDRHPTVDAYAAAKARIFANQTTNDWAVLNADDAAVLAHARGAAARRELFSLEGGLADGVVIDGDAIVRRAGTDVERLIPLPAVQLTGRHMLNNVLAAAAASHIAGVRAASMIAALDRFHGLPHVMEPVVVAIIGGRYKGGNFGELADALETRGRAVIAIGEAASRVRDALASTVPVIEAKSMREAVERGYEAAKPDGVVLLAPACSSFDWFRDYAERGEAFQEEVKRLREQ